MITDPAQPQRSRSRSCARSSPARSATTEASDSATISAAQISWLQAWATCPAPRGPLGHALSQARHECVDLLGARNHQNHEVRLARHVPRLVDGAGALRLEA